MTTARRFHTALFSLAFLGLAALAPRAAAQGGGFTAGEVFIYNAAAQGLSSQSGAIVRCDPVTGTASLYVDLFTSQQQVGAAVFDPYRQRVVFSGSIHTALEPMKVWFVDGAGVTTDPGLGAQIWYAMAPVGDGRIYFRDFNDNTHPLKWIDAANVVHVLLDSTGTAPFAIDGNLNYTIGGMIYDAGQNALFAASNVTCPGGTANRMNVRKLSLSADGKRVTAVGCSEFDVSSSGVTPAGWARLPNGMLLLGADTNSNSQEPRMLMVDPATSAISPYASNGNYTGAAASNALCFSSDLGKALLLDTFNDVLRAYSFGEVGDGSVITPSFPISSNGGSGETPAMFEVPFSACAGGWISYGAGLAGAGGFVPTLSGGGCPKIGTGFTLKMDSIVGGANGALFLGLAPGALPFKGGTLQLASVLLTFNLSVGGLAGSPGAGVLTLPAALPLNPGLTGLSIFLQSAWSDAAAVQHVSLSNGLELEIG